MRNVQVKIRKTSEEQLLSVLEINQDIIIWAYHPEWIVYSDNFLELNQSVGLVTDSLLKVLPKVDERTEITAKEQAIEFTRWNNVRKYMTKYTLARSRIDGEKREKIVKIEEIILAEVKELIYEMPGEIRKILSEELQESLLIKRDERLYFSDKEETIVIPVGQEESKGKMDREYGLEEIKKVVNGLDKVGKVKMEIVGNGLMRITMELDGGIKFYLVIAELEKNN